MLQKFVLKEVSKQLRLSRGEGAGAGDESVASTLASPRPGGQCRRGLKSCRFWAHRGASTGSMGSVHKEVRPTRPPLRRARRSQVMPWR